MSKSREQLNAYLKNINIDGKTILDVGVQDKPASMLAQGKAKKYLTLDIDPQWKPDVIGDLNKDYLEWQWDNNTTYKFDVIFCIETMEHLWNPVKALYNLEQLLSPGGVAYVSAPFINPIHDTHDMLRYTDEWYQIVGRRLGFKEVIVKERVATAGLDSLLEFYKKEGLRMSKIRHANGEGHKIKVIGYFVEMRK